MASARAPSSSRYAHRMRVSSQHQRTHTPSRPHLVSTTRFSLSLSLSRQPEELSYALGKKGMTRKKLARSSQCIVEYVGYTVFMSGMPDERARAKEYLDWLFDQLRGPVYVDNWEQRDDVTMVDVPRDCVGYVTGARRATLGKIEEEWGTLMFFMSTNMRRDDRGQGSDRREFDGSEKLAIFGDRRGRRGAELKCMSAVETKRRGYFTREVKKHTSDKEGARRTPTRWTSRSSRMRWARTCHDAPQARARVGLHHGVRRPGRVHLWPVEERTRARTYLKWLVAARRLGLCRRPPGARRRHHRAHPERCDRLC